MSYQLDRRFVRSYIGHKMSDDLALQEAPPKWRITKENARAMALKSHEPTSARYVHPVEPATETQTSDLFRLNRLAVVRAQLERLDKMICNEEDAQRLDKLASAVQKLSERERQLSNRPLPGSLRPSDKRNRPTQPVPQGGFASEG